MTRKFFLLLLGSLAGCAAQKKPIVAITPVNPPAQPQGPPGSEPFESCPIGRQNQPWIAQESIALAVGITKAMHICSVCGVGYWVTA